MTILEEIESLLSKVAYKPRIQRQHKIRGKSRVESRMYYRKHRSAIKKRMHVYRKRYKNLLKARKRRPSYRRIG